MKHRKQRGRGILALGVGIVPSSDPPAFSFGEDVIPTYLLQAQRTCPSALGVCAQVLELLEVVKVLLKHSLVICKSQLIIEAGV